MENKKSEYELRHLRIQEIIRDPSISPGAKVVLWRLIEYRGGKNYSFPSQETLAKEVAMSTRMVRYHIKLLRSKKIIDTKRKTIINPKTNKPIKSNIYYLDYVLRKKA